MSNPWSKTTQESTRQYVRWLLRTRAGVLVVTFIYCLIIPLWSETTQFINEGVYWGLTVFFVACIGSMWWVKAGVVNAVFLFSQSLLDVFFVTGLIYLTDGPASPFLVLYLPLVMFSASAQSRGVALTLSAVITLTYCLLLGGLSIGLLPPTGDNYILYMPLERLILQVVGLSSAMILITVATSFLTRRLNLSHALIEESRKHVFEITNKQRAVINGLIEGIIITQPDEKVASINAAACSLLGLSENQVIDMQFSDVLRRLDENTVWLGSDEHKVIEPRELLVHRENPLRSKRISYHGRPLHNEAGLWTGMVFVFQDVTKLRSIEEQLEIQERMARLLSSSDEISTEPLTKLTNFVGESPVMQKIFRLIEKVSQSDATVLINGESGTGKELVARAIHLGSNRAMGAFVAVNCGAIPETLIESELFGYKKGSFTGAQADSKGLFRQAEGGTIFLDEIGEIPLLMQVKLLRAIQERKVRPIGGEGDLPIDVRVIAATNKNLKVEVEKQRFREDLFYRINVITVQLPPLRDRKEDIPILVNAILRRLTKGIKMPVLAPASMQLLLSYHYPGNVRELENIIERALVLGGDAILPEHLPEVVQFAKIHTPSLTSAQETTILVDERIQFPVDLDAILSGVEKKYLEVALVRTNGVKKRAAELLGINFRSIRYRLQKFGISEED